MARLFHLLLPWTSPIANRIKGEFTLRERGSKSHPPAETILGGEGNETAGQQLPQLNSHYAVKSIGPLTPPISPPSETFIPSSPSEQKDPPVKILRSTLKQAERERGRGRISIQRRPLIIIEPVGVSLIPDKEGAARMRFGARTNPRGKYENREEETVDRYAFPPPRNPYWLSQRYWITIEGFVQEEIFY